MGVAGRMHQARVLGQGQRRLRGMRYVVFPSWVLWLNWLGWSIVWSRMWGTHVLG